MIMELSGEFPVKLLCETMGILRSSFYSWKKHLSNPSDRTKNLVNCVLENLHFYVPFLSKIRLSSVRKSFPGGAQIESLGICEWFCADSQNLTVTSIHI